MEHLEKLKDAWMNEWECKFSLNIHESRRNDLAYLWAALKWTNFKQTAYNKFDFKFTNDVTHP